MAGGNIFSLRVNLPVDFYFVDESDQTPLCDPSQKGELLDALQLHIQ